jgi:hydroxymethylbilane synthase
MDGRGDALAVAKAALDRLLTPESPVTSSQFPVTSSQFPRPGSDNWELETGNWKLRQQLDRCAWMVLPMKDVPTAPAQGALAAEVNASRTVVRERLEQITHRPTWDAVCREREILERHGGGCHQALGATILPRSYGMITSVRARSANGCASTWSLASDAALPPRTFVGNIWPRPEERGQGQRTPLHVPQLSGSPDLWISRAEALPEHWALSPSQLVWVAGSTTWRRLAARGVWVHGCADGLGDEEVPNVAALGGRAPRWCRLTHASADEVRSEPWAIATYSVQTALPEDLSRRTHFYWTSGALFRDCLARWPEIADRWHASGPGRTSRVIRDMLGSGAKFRVWLEYDDWVREILD